MSEFTQGVCEDGAVILKDGEPLTPEQIISALYRAQDIYASGSQKLDAFEHINSLCWNAKGMGKKEISIDEVLEIVEQFCEP